MINHMTTSHVRRAMKNASGDTEYLGSFLSLEDLKIAYPEKEKHKNKEDKIKHKQYDSKKLNDSSWAIVDDGINSPQQYKYNCKGKWIEMGGSGGEGESNHEKLTNIMGGLQGEHYHLSEEELILLKNNKGYFESEDALYQKFPNGSEQLKGGEYAYVDDALFGIYLYEYTPMRNVWIRDATAGWISKDELLEGVMVKSYDTINPVQGDSRLKKQGHKIYFEMFDNGEWTLITIIGSVTTDTFNMINGQDNSITGINDILDEKFYSIYRRHEVYKDGGKEIINELGSIDRDTIINASNSDSLVLNYPKEEISQTIADFAGSKLDVGTYEMTFIATESMELNMAEFQTISTSRARMVIMDTESNIPIYESQPRRDSLDTNGIEIKDETTGETVGLIKAKFPRSGFVTKDREYKITLDIIEGALVGNKNFIYLKIYGKSKVSETLATREWVNSNPQSGWDKKINLINGDNIEITFDKPRDIVEPFDLTRTEFQVSGSIDEPTISTINDIPTINYGNCNLVKGDELVVGIPVSKTILNKEVEIWYYINQVNGSNVIINESKIRIGDGSDLIPFTMKIDRIDSNAIIKIKTTLINPKFDILFNEGNDFTGSSSMIGKFIGTETEKVENLFVDDKINPDFMLNGGWDKQLDLKDGENISVTFEEYEDVLTTSDLDVTTLESKIGGKIPTPSIEEVDDIKVIGYHRLNMVNPNEWVTISIQAYPIVLQNKPVVFNYTIKSKEDAPVINLDTIKLIGIRGEDLEAEFELQEITDHDYNLKIITKLNSDKFIIKFGQYNNLSMAYSTLSCITQKPTLTTKVENLFIDNKINPKFVSGGTPTPNGEAFNEISLIENDGIDPTIIHDSKIGKLKIIEASVDNRGRSYLSFGNVMTETLISSSKDIYNRKLQNQIEITMNGEREPIVFNKDEFSLSFVFKNEQNSIKELSPYYFAFLSNRNSKISASIYEIETDSIIMQKTELEVRLVQELESEDSLSPALAMFPMDIGKGRSLVMTDGNSYRIDFECQPNVLYGSKILPTVTIGLGEEIISNLIDLNYASKYYNKHTDATWVISSDMDPQEIVGFDIQKSFELNTRTIPEYNKDGWEFTSIADNVFNSNCNGKIFVPQTITHIGDGNFKNEGGFGEFIVIGKIGSCADEYCQRNNLTFESDGTIGIPSKPNKFLTYNSEERFEWKDIVGTVYLSETMRISAIGNKFLFESFDGLNWNIVSEIR